jgi:universal stress protein E
MPVIETVVIGTTLSEASDAVVSAGIRLARAVGARAHLVHAVELSPLYGGAPYVPLPAFDSERLAVETARCMSEQIERLGLGPVVRHVVVERAHHALLDVAHEVGADLIVVGAADSPLAQVFGSTTGRVARKARCPVLVVRGPLALPPARVLLPIDLSPLSVEVTDRAFAILDRVMVGIGGASFPRRDLEVEALHCVVPLGHEEFVPLFDPEEETRRSVGRLEELLGPRRDAGWKVETRARFGAAREKILARIEEWRPDLVILGTHGASGFERLLIGSVAQSVLERSQANVLIIPPLAAQAARAVAA